MADDKKIISVGMSACGIAAGARQVMNSFAREIRTCLLYTSRGV